MKFFTLPNQLTFLRILLTPVFMILLFSHDNVLLQWSLVVFILAAITDWYDGWLARRWGYVTRWGVFFDPLADKVVTSGALIAYAYLDLVPAWTVWVTVVRDVLITFLRSYAEYKGKPVDTSKLAKTKTFAQFVIIYYLLILYVALHTPFLFQRFGELIEALLNYSLVYTLMVIITAITLWTGIVYVVENRKTIRELYDFSSRAPESQ